MLFHSGPPSGAASRTRLRNCSSVRGVRATPIMAKVEESARRRLKLARAGKILRWARSPEAPKTTMATGGECLSASRPAGRGGVASRTVEAAGSVMQYPSILVRAGHLPLAGQSVRLVTQPVEQLGERLGEG